MIRTLVVGTDFSPASEHALQYAVDLAAQLGASVEVVHAFAVPAFNLPIEGAVISPAEYAVQQSSDAQEQLDQQLAGQAARGVPLRGHLRAGTAHEELVHFADEVAADLIVVGTHARRGAAHLLLGSVAENVVRASRIPVLTVTPPSP